MEQFITTLVFVTPGLMAYYWLLKLGLSPAQKHNNFEMLSISTILWVPTILTMIIVHNLLASSKNFGLIPIETLTDFTAYSLNFSFMLYFLFSSLIFSLVISFLTVWLNKYLVKFVNQARKVLGLASFSKNSTVWEEFFNYYGSKVVKVQKIDKMNEEGQSLIGSLSSSSSVTETDRSICLDDTVFFTHLVSKYKPAIEKVLVDTKAGLTITIYQASDIKRIQEENDIEAELDAEKIISF